MSLRNVFATIGIALAATLALGPSAAAQTAPSPAPAEKTEYFLGEVVMNAASGSSLGSQLSLVRRTESLAQGKITESVIAIKGDDSTREYITNYAVTGTQFTISDPDKTYTGEGELIGPPSEWTSVKYTVNFNGGLGTIIGLDTRTDEGIVSKKTFLGSDGKVGVRFSTTLRKITPAAYMILRKKLLGS